MLKGGTGKELQIPALFAVIHHPEAGYLLFDTGYHTRFLKVISKFPYSLIRLATPVSITSEENADNQLEAMGISPDEISTIILSHCHADHTSGLKDFPDTRIVLSKTEWKAADVSPLRAFIHANLKPLYASMEKENIKIIDFEKEGTPYGIFPQTVDLLGDGTLIAVNLPGHSPGNMGLLVNSPDSRFFLIGDAAWLRRNYLEMKPAHRLMNFIVTDKSQMMENLGRLHEVANKNPEIIIVPSHCPETWAEIQESINTNDKDGAGQNR